MSRLLNNKILLVGVSLFMGLTIGWILFHQSDQKGTEDTVKDNEQITTYTCSMHPQIRRNEPGDCPICGMELIPVSEFSSNPNIVEMSDDAVMLSNIQTSPVSFALPEKEIYLQGKVKVDERRVSNQTSHLPGRIEKLYVSFTGEKVYAGQKIASIYSPDLVTAQKELFEAIKMKESSPILCNAARNKLKLWKLSDKQIDEIEKNGEIKEVVDIRADINGVVLKRNVSVGDYVNEGSVLFTVADLSKLWVEFDAYEADIPWLEIGDEISFTVSSLPGTQFKQRIAFIDPIINAQTRTASIRLEISNKDGQLKPEMFATGIVMAKLPIDEAHLTVPKSAVMWTGKRSVVYVAVPQAETPMFEFREVTLGLDLGGYFIVEDGLKDGENVVTNGAFKVDAAAQLSGKNSMMNKVSEQSIDDHQHDNLPDLSGLDKLNLKVNGHCDMCKSRIENTVSEIAGVVHTNWNKETKMLTVHFDGNETDEDVIQRAIADAGHDTEFNKAPDKKYKELPNCCKYTRESH